MVYQKQNRTWLAVAAVNIVVFFILAELGSLAFYYWRDGRLFYTNQNKTRHELAQNDEDHILTDLRFHPFFGFINQPGAVRFSEGRPITYNNYGFLSDYNYPVVKTDEDMYIIHNIPYFHFLQPNQYYSKKSFSAEEAQIALNVNSVYGQNAAEGYPFLVEESNVLTRNGVNFYNALDIFDETSAIIYADDCCHFNQQGNRILADAMAAAILARLDVSHQPK